MDPSVRRKSQVEASQVHACLDPDCMTPEQCVFARHSKPASRVLLHVSIDLAGVDTSLVQPFQHERLFLAVDLNCVQPTQQPVPKVDVHPVGGDISLQDTPRRLWHRACHCADHHDR